MLVNCLLAGEVDPHGLSHQYITSYVPIEYQRHNSLPLLSATDVAAGITNQYLRIFVHTDLYHLLKIFGF